METILISLAVGVALGIFIEWKYGGKGAQMNASLHEKLDEIKAALTDG